MGFKYSSSVRSFQSALTRIALGVLISFVSGCGYSLQNSNHLSNLETRGVRTIFIAPLKNDTFKPGVENLVYNELVKIIASGKRVRIVLDEEKADAVLTGTVTQADYVPTSQTTANLIYPTNTGSSQTLVATEYNASLACSLSLVSTSRYTGPKKGTIWGAGFSRSKVFPGNNQMGIYGNTAALINDSEFDRALKDLTLRMSSDIHESMLALF